MYNIKLENEVARQLLSNFSKLRDKESINKDNDKILISKQNNNLTASYNTSKFSITKSVELDDNDKFEFLVDSDLVKKALNTIDKDKDISLNLNDKGTFSIENKKDSIKMATSLLENPIYYDLQKEYDIESIDQIEIATLEKVLKSHSDVVSKDHTKEKLNCVWIEKNSIVTTDSFQMLVTENVNLKLNKVGIHYDFINKLLIEFKSLSKEDKEKDATLKVGVAKDFYLLEVSFKANCVTTVLKTKVIRNYIYWESLYNKENLGNHDFYNLEIKEYKKALKKIKNFVSKDLPVVKFTIDNDNLILESNLKNSRFMTELKILNPGATLKEPIGLSHRYLSQYLTIFKNLKEIKLYIRDNENIVYFKNGNNIYILMPMSLT